jgi:hypothetical protein
MVMVGCVLCGHGPPIPINTPAQYTDTVYETQASGTGAQPSAPPTCNVGRISQQLQLLRVGHQASQAWRHLRLQGVWNVCGWCTAYA